MVAKRWFSNPMAPSTFTSQHWILHCTPSHQIITLRFVHLLIICEDTWLFCFILQDIAHYYLFYLEVQIVQELRKLTLVSFWHDRIVPRTIYSKLLFGVGSWGAFSRHSPWNWQFLWGTLIPFSGAWFVETRIWLLDVVVAAQLPFLGPFSGHSWGFSPETLQSSFIHKVSALSSPIYTFAPSYICTK